MGTIFNDLFIRSTFNDIGVEPVADSAVSMSPDIIPYGQSTLTQQQLIDQYGPPLLNRTFDRNNYNNIYVRTKNNYNGATSGKITLYYTTANLLVNVNSWKTNQVQNANGQLYANVSATQQNQIAPGDQPFYFNPPPQLFRHFCFLGILSTAMHPYAPPADNFVAWDDFVNWVRGHANVAWHNADIIDTLPAQGYANSLAFENVDASPQFYGFQCSYRNLPPGSILRLSAQPNSSVNFAGFDTQMTINNINGQIAAGASFPPGYSTTVFTTCQFPGAPTTPPPNVSIDTTSLGYQLTARDPSSLDRFPEAHVEPEVLGIVPGDYRLDSGGKFINIMSFTSLLNPQH